MVVTLTVGCFSRGTVLLFLLLLAALVIGMTATGENTPPTVEINTPGEGAVLGLTVTVSGNATDAEGFNIFSYVEARWNDWEWFNLPATPANVNRSIIFGEMVNLDWHTPGEHVLQVRAFDGELFSGVAQVTVTVRDLADIVVLPSDITLDPEEKNDLSAEHPRLTEHLQASLSQLSESPDSPEVEMPEDLRESLRSLGYIE